MVRGAPLLVLSFIGFLRLDVPQGVRVKVVVLSSALRRFLSLSPILLTLLLYHKMFVLSIVFFNFFQEKVEEVSVCY